jgi:hypothetical protein
VVIVVDELIGVLFAFFDISKIADREWCAPSGARVIRPRAKASFQVGITTTSFSR